jgi:hypothetical protein
VSAILGNLKIGQRLSIQIQRGDQRLKGEIAVEEAP